MTVCWLGEEAAATLSEGRRAARRLVGDAVRKNWAARGTARTARGAGAAAGAAAIRVLELSALIGASGRRWELAIAGE